MTPEMQKAFDDAAVPFIEGGGAIGLAETRMKSWRYFLEVGSACNLHCPTCTKGGHPGYEHENGWMNPDLMERILDKIAAENPSAIVFLYGNSEPFLHKRLPECIASIKRRGLNAQFSTNLNYTQRVDDVLAANPDMIIISLSGWTQEIYERGHAGGKIEKVKINMRDLALANHQANPRIAISVNYHVYNDNQHEVAPMREFAQSLGFGFFTSLARAISMENAIQYCRSMCNDATPFDLLPPIGKTYEDAMKRLMIPPDRAWAMYKDLPANPAACPIGSMFTFIRHDGKTEMCACVADRRLVLGDYLTTSQDQLIEQRANHPICQQCSRYKLRYYFHLTDRKRWEPPV